MKKKKPPHSKTIDTSCLNQCMFLISQWFVNQYQCVCFPPFDPLSSPVIPADAACLINSLIVARQQIKHRKAFVEISGDFNLFFYALLTWWIAVCLVLFADMMET